MKVAKTITRSCLVLAALVLTTMALAGCDEYGLSVMGLGGLDLGGGYLGGYDSSYLADAERSDWLVDEWVATIGGYYDGGEWDQSGFSGDGEW